MSRSSKAPDWPPAASTPAVPSKTAPTAYHRSITLDRITTDPEVMVACRAFAACGCRSRRVVAMVADGMTTDEIISDLPDLTPEDVTEALRFAAEAIRERERPLRHSA